ncbi:MAG: ABC transporter permease [Hyphomicrobiaceae bacterium]|nr:ABC transporter permease [Hyphomicrobiaceae bacterium]
MTPVHALRALNGVVARELARFLGQYTRLAGSLVRPLLWLVVFAAGFRAALGLSITEPYQTYITYEIYVVPGLVGMVLLFAAMQGALSMVFDREMGSMRVLLLAPLPRPFLLFAKLVAITIVAVAQAYAFLAIAWLWGVDFPAAGFLTVLPAAILAALMLAAVGLLLSALIKQLENFAGVMNFIIFPAFFLSSALYPLWKMQESSEALALVCRLNPFTHAVELIRFALYGRVDALGLAVTTATLAIAFALACWAYDPGRGFRPARGGD